MQFVNPSFLWALSLLSIPILIHLFYFRRFKKLDFPALRFLKEVQLESQSSRNLKRWLVLITRLLAFTFLILGFAKPFFPKPQTEVTPTKKVISIYLDNSQSMTIEGGRGSLLELAKNQIRELVKTSGSQDVFQLITNDFVGGTQRVLDKNKMLEKLDEVELSSVNRSFEEVFQRQQEWILRNQDEFSNATAYVFSDFQKTSFQPSLKLDTSFKTFFVPLTGNTVQNVSIDSAWLSTPYVKSNGSIAIKVLVSNKGNMPVDETTIRLKIDGKEKGISPINLEVKEQKELNFNLKLEGPGWHQLDFELLDYPITFDDQLYLSLLATDHLPVLIIEEEQGKLVNALYQTDSFFKISEKNVLNLEYGIIHRQNLIVLQQVSSISAALADELNRFVQMGGSLVVIPPANGNASALNNLLRLLGGSALGGISVIPNQIEKLEEEHPIFKEALLKKGKNEKWPQISKYYRFESNNARDESLIKLQTGDDFLRATRSGKGALYTFAGAMESDWGTFHLHYLFPTTMLNMAFKSQKSSVQNFVLGKDAWLEVMSNMPTDKESIFEISNSELTYIPQVYREENKIKLLIGNEWQNKGHFNLKEKGKKEVIQSVSFNLSRAESDLDFWKSDELRKEFGLSDAVTVFDENTSNRNLIASNKEKSGNLWKTFIGLALLFVLVEVLLLRFLK